MEKEHLETLLEDIRGKFELVLEGHSAHRAGTETHLHNKVPE